MGAQGRIDTDDLRIRFAIRQTWIAVESIAADAGGVRQRLAISLFKQNADRQMKRMVPFPLEPIEQLLDARLMRDRRIGVWLFRRRLGRVFAAQTMNVIKFFGSLVIGLKRVVLQRPSRGNPVGMPDFIEVPLAQPQQDGAIDFAVAAHEIMQAGMKILAVGAVPGLECLIARIDEYGLAVPILTFAGQVVTALEKEDTLSGLRQTPCHGAAAGPGANDDDIVMFAIAHQELPSANEITSDIAAETGFALFHKMANV